VTDVERLDHTEIIVDVSKTLRRSVDPTPRSRPSSRELAKVYAPMKCKVKSGPGEYVISARMRLGRPHLTCASTMSEWVRLVRNANADGSAPCVLAV
jgi:hypothetical protein